MFIFQVRVICLMLDEKVNVKHFISGMIHKPNVLNFESKYSVSHLYDCSTADEMIPKTPMIQQLLHSLTLTPKSN